ncbi:MAG: aconitase family protein, partial [Vicinamibacteria bacterium]
PGSERVFRTIQRDGQMKVLEDAGATVLANACGPCIGQWKRSDVKPGTRNSILTSYNRNFARRNDGSAETMAFIGSPEIVVAYALDGRLTFNPLTDDLTDSHGKPFHLRPPRPAPEVPEKGFVLTQEGYIAPAEDGSKIEVRIDPKSERLQVLAPFPPWDGGDFLDLPLLFKARGACTTDHISPAGPWLGFRGHLERISDNLFAGGVNAFTGASGVGLDQVTGEASVSFAKIARRYREKGLRWVVVGDENYGAGSSREHAAMSPRYLGAAAVIVRSFARIHESNLKKQGILPLTFADPADYEKVEERDRVSITGLRDLSPRAPVTALLRHADGRTETLTLRHSLNSEQINWFKAGSALNLLASQ